MTKKIAQIILGKLLNAARKSLGKYDRTSDRKSDRSESTGNSNKSKNSEIFFLKPKLREANNERGIEIIAPNTVDTNAIFNVSTIPIQAVEHVKSMKVG